MSLPSRYPGCAPSQADAVEPDGPASGHTAAEHRRARRIATSGAIIALTLTGCGDSGHTSRVSDPAAKASLRTAVACAELDDAGPNMKAFVRLAYREGAGHAYFGRIGERCSLTLPANPEVESSFTAATFVYVDPTWRPLVSLASQSRVAFLNIAGRERGQRANELSRQLVQNALKHANATVESDGTLVPVTNTSAPLEPDQALATQVAADIEGVVAELGVEPSSEVPVDPEGHVSGAGKETTELRRPATADRVAGQPAPEAVASTSSWKRCALALDSRPTLSVRAMTCADALTARRRLDEDNPGVYRIPFGATRRFRTIGRTRGTQQRLTCSVGYSKGAGDNRGGIQMTIRCRDFKVNGFNYTEQQDGE